MKKFKIGLFLYIGDEPDPVLLAERTYNQYNYKQALHFLEYQIEKEDHLTIAIKEVK